MTDLTPSQLPANPAPDWKITSANPRAPQVSHPVLRQTVNCHKTGVALGVLEVCIVESAAPFVQNFQTMQMVHPFFGLSEYVILKKLEESLNFCWSRAWEVDSRQIERIQILMAVIMDRLGIYRSDEPTLPDESIAVGSAHRLFKLSKWWMDSTTRRIQFPTYSATRRNGNLHWENFKTWLDAAFEYRAAWEKAKAKVETDEELRIREAAAREARKSGGRRVNLNRIWNWLELQFRGHIPTGRIITLKEIFFTADLQPEDFLKDDIDDLAEAVIEYTDIGNDLTLYIRDRLAAMYEANKDYYDSFVVVNRAGSFVSEKPTALEIQKENSLYKEYDDIVRDLLEPPPPPNPADFRGDVPLRLKAEARHRLLLQRWTFLQARKLDPNAGKPSITPVGSLQRLENKIEDHKARGILDEGETAEEEREVYSDLQENQARAAAEPSESYDESDED